MVGDHLGALEDEMREYEVVDIKPDGSFVAGACGCKECPEGCDYLYPDSLFSAAIPSWQEQYEDAERANDKPAL